MKVTPYTEYLCPCGFAMLTADRPFNHLIYCENPRCEHRGKFFEKPQFELKPGKAFREE